MIFSHYHWSQWALDLTILGQWSRWNVIGRCQTTLIITFNETCMFQSGENNVRIRLAVNHILYSFGKNQCVTRIFFLYFLWRSPCLKLWISGVHALEHFILPAELWRKGLFYNAMPLLIPIFQNNEYSISSYFCKITAQCNALIHRYSGRFMSYRYNNNTSAITM